MKKDNKKKKEYIFIVLALLLMGVGSFVTYSIYRTTLTGNGTITTSAWSIVVKKGTNVVQNLNFGMNDINWTTHNGENGKIAPGDSGTINYTIDASGSEVDVKYIASIGTITGPTGLTASISPASGTIAHATGVGQMTQQLVVTVTWTGDENDDDTKDTNDMNNSNSSVITIPVTLTVRQDLSTTAYVVSSTTMNIGQAVPSTLLPSGVALRNNPNDAMADWDKITGTSGDTRPFYLKHIIENNQILESYVEFVVTPEIATANPGMVEGTYTLIGGDSGAAYTDNVNTIKTAFDYTNHSSRCNEHATGLFNCYATGLYASANPDGHVSSNDNGEIPMRYCYIYNDGHSSCS